MTWEAPLQDGSLARPIPCIMGCPRERYLPGAVSSLQVPLGLRSAALMEEPPAPWLLPPQFPSRQVPVPVQGSASSVSTRAQHALPLPPACQPAPVFPSCSNGGPLWGVRRREDVHRREQTARETGRNYSVVIARKGKQLKCPPTRMDR